MPSIALAALAAVTIEGFMNGNLSRLHRSLFVVIAVACVAPYFAASLGTICIGGALLTRDNLGVSTANEKETKTKKFPEFDALQSYEEGMSHCAMPSFFARV